MNLVTRLYNTFVEAGQKNAVFSEGKAFTYSTFLQKINGIRAQIREEAFHNQQIFGLWITDDLPCYASIIALWFEGRAYVPLNPAAPAERNLDIISQAGFTTILSAEQALPYEGFIHIHTDAAFHSEVRSEPPVPLSDDALMYILFTSGTTGRPKGVPVLLSNLEAFIVACERLDLDIDENDRCLQMFNMTFDMSVMSYLLCFSAGACLYPIPRTEIKYQYVYQLLDEQKITVAFMVPSILNYLRPYFWEIFLPYLRINLFAGEALVMDVTEEWSRCVPNATIMNAYGPTENTIICTAYTMRRDGHSKTYNGILSIGAPMQGNKIIIIDEEQNLLPAGEAGQMCLGGPQLTSGYWNAAELNNEAFFEKEYEGTLTRFYKSGDLCRMDTDGEIYYSGRIDFQAKIQGFRVELSEIEHYCKAACANTNLVAVAFVNEIGNTEIGLAIEGGEISVKSLNTYLKGKLPAYMIPTKVIFEPHFPLSAAGKVDRKKITTLFAKK